MPNFSKGLSQIINVYMSRTGGLREHCERCLQTKRWGGSVVLMVVDAAFTSIGLNYFTAVVPSVVKFERELIISGKVQNLRELSLFSVAQMQRIWRNSRSWQMAKNVAFYLANLAAAEGLDDRGALQCWAASSRLENWEKNPIGKIKGVGVVTFQYLRMMGGIDTAMPDKIVRRVIEQILNEAELGMPTKGDLELVTTIEQMSQISGYGPTEICWMTWLLQPEGHMIKMDKYRDLLDRI